MLETRVIGAYVNKPLSISTVERPLSADSKE